MFVIRVTQTQESGVKISDSLFRVAGTSQGVLRGGEIAVIDGVFEPDSEQGVRFVAAEAIEADDRPGLEHPLRYCARPPFASKRLKELDAQRLIYRLPKRDGMGAPRSSSQRWR
jgi:hypothetical protein